VRHYVSLRPHALQRTGRREVNCGRCLHARQGSARRAGERRRGCFAALQEAGGPKLRGRFNQSPPVACTLPGCEIGVCLEGTRSAGRWQCIIELPHRQAFGFRNEIRISQKVSGVAVMVPAALQLMSLGRRAPQVKKSAVKRCVPPKPLTRRAASV